MGEPAGPFAPRRCAAVSQLSRLFRPARAGNGTFSGIASYEGGTATLESEGEARHLDVSTVSANFFQVLGVAPMLGRDFRPDDEKPGNRAVMLSYSLWRTAFGSAEDVAARTIRLGGRSYAIAGVMPLR